MKNEDNQNGRESFENLSVAGNIIQLKDIGFEQAY
jgi:hypothetical protein